MDCLGLWDRLGHDFLCTPHMVNMFLSRIDWARNGIKKWGGCIEFLMNRGCPVCAAREGGNSMRHRLANLCLIPVLLRPRWIKSKSLPAVLVRMVKETLTGFGIKIKRI